MCGALRTSVETPRRRISVTHCSCNIWSHESAWRPTPGVSRLLKQVQQERQPNSNHTSAPVTFDQLSAVLSVGCTLPYHCHPRMGGSHKTQALDRFQCIADEYGSAIVRWVCQGAENRSLAWYIRTRFGGRWVNAGSKVSWASTRRRGASIRTIVVAVVLFSLPFQS